MLADSSSERATCSTIWLGDQFPGPSRRGPFAGHHQLVNRVFARREGRVDIRHRVLPFSVMLRRFYAPNGFSSAVGPSAIRMT